MEEPKKRRRRTAEERLADLERKRLEILERQREALAKIEEEKRKLSQSRPMRRAMLENQRRFERAVQKLAPEWDHRHFVAAVEKALSEDPEALASRGGELLEAYGKSRRGRKPRAG
ncbi:hypothetical protein BAE30_11525 [Acidithiobacillus caldus]|jgi:membrane protein involved in colicin uptake|uniref:Uncharacterized protein n=1 Tax=Acidithiobacillus caldus TaxID=33059 RepID=A0A1E7YTE8_9PROT|nr:hypothetical protein BAE30_11525 [Acidithiobacillus caldus]